MLHFTVWHFFMQHFLGEVRFSRKSFVMKVLSVLFLCFNILLANAQCEGFEAPITFTHPTCPGFHDGSVHLMPTGGATPYEVIVKNSMDEIMTEGFVLEAGWYYTSVTDDLGCEILDSVELIDPIEIEVESISYVLPSDGETCDGEISIESVTGDFDILYYFWSPDPHGISGEGANTLSDVCEGVYNLTLSNEIGCSTDELPISIGPLTSFNEHANQFNYRVEQNNLVIECFYLNANYNLLIAGIDGKLIHQSRILKESTNISLPFYNQIYSVSIINDNGIVWKRNIILLD